MATELIIIIGVSGIALLPIAISLRTPVLQVSLLLAWLTFWFFVSPQYNTYREQHRPEIITNRPIEKPRDGYVGAKECKACHPGEHNSWTNSWHRTMTQVASPISVFGDFSGVDLEWQGWKTRLERRGDKFYANVYEGGKYDWHEIVLTTGSHHMQAYWYSRGENKRLGQLLFTYLKEDQRWVPRDSVFLKPPTTVPSDETGNWNQSCIGCHATRGRPGFTEGSSTVNTEAVEFGISCEACHGPGAEHANTNRLNPLRRYQKHLEEGGDDSIVNASRILKERSAEVCGQCHGIKTPMNQIKGAMERGFDYRAGDVLDDTGASILRGGPGAAGPENPMTEELHDMFFWPDGMARPSGREVNGLIESPCYKRGDLTCVSCHKMHKSDDDARSFLTWADDMLGPQMRTNEACLQCHEDFAQKVEAHSRHAPGSSGNQCLNCHMPYTTWGLLKAIRQHEIDVPSANSTVAYGRPNACNACHIDKSLDWSAQWLAKWFNQPVPDMSDDDRTTAASLRWLLQGDAGQRALAAWYLGWAEAQNASGTDWIAPQLATLLEDPYDAVRYVAGKSLRTLPGYEDVEYDYMGPAAALASAKQATWTEFREQTNANRSMGAPMDPARARSLLLYPDGSLDRLTISKLLRQRDDKRVQIAE
jgi:hypothetical protein